MSVYTLTVKYEQRATDHTQAMSNTSDDAKAELATEKFHHCKKEATVAVVRYLYGLSPFPEDNHPHHADTTGKDSHDEDAHSPCSHDEDPDTGERGSLKDWINLCSVAEGFEVPSLLQLTLGKIEDYLKSRLAATDFDGNGAVHEDAALQFVEAVQFIHDAAVMGDVAAKAVAAKMCGEHYTTLRGFESFNEFIEYYPELVRDVLDFFMLRGLREWWGRVAKGVVVRTWTGGCAANQRDGSCL